MTKNKSLILAFSLVAGLMSSTAMADMYSASTSINSDKSVVQLDGHEAIIYWKDKGGTASDSRETLGNIATDQGAAIAEEHNKGGGEAAGPASGGETTVSGGATGSTSVALGKPAPALPNTEQAAGTALVETILAAGSGKPDATSGGDSKPGVEQVTMSRGDVKPGYNPTIVGAVAMLAPAAEKPTVTVDGIKTDKVDAIRQVTVVAPAQFAEFDKADKVSVDKPVIALADAFVRPATVVDSKQVDKTDAKADTKIATVTVDKYDTKVAAIKEMASLSLAVESKQVIDRVASVDKIAQEKTVLADQQVQVSAEKEKLARIDNLSKLDSLAKLEEKSDSLSNMKDKVGDLKEKSDNLYEKLSDSGSSDKLAESEMKVGK